ncbi:MAG: extracellular solute-binding protein, partial [Deinococcus sp.]|nr:extracellular solute-binding protein [Deinococcus sp.]
RLGLTPPTTWEGLLELGRNLSAAGVTPMAVPIGDGWPGFIWFEELIFRQDPDFYYRLVVGEEKYTNDLVVRALDTIGQLVQTGFFGDPNTTLVLTIPDMLRGLVEERYAMVLIGDWISGSFAASGADFGAYDWFVLPNLNPSLGQLMVAETGPLAASATGPNVDAALQALDAWMSPQAQEAWSLAIGLIFTNARSDVSQLADNKARLLNAVNTQGITVINRIWEAAPPQVIVPASSVMGRIFAEPNNAASIAQEIQGLADAFFGA